MYTGRRPIAIDIAKCNILKCSLLWQCVRSSVLCVQVDTRLYVVLYKLTIHVLVDLFQVWTSGCVSGWFTEVVEPLNRSYFITCMTKHTYLSISKLITVLCKRSSWIQSIWVDRNQSPMHVFIVDMYILLYGIVFKCFTFLRQYNNYM